MRGRRGDVPLPLLLPAPGPVLPGAPVARTAAPGQDQPRYPVDPSHLLLQLWSVPTSGRDSACNAVMEVLGGGGVGVGLAAIL